MKRWMKKFSVVLSVVLVASMALSVFGNSTTVAQEEEWKKVPITESYEKYPPFFHVTQIAPIGNKVREQYTQATNLNFPKIGIDADFKLLEFGDLINREFNNYYGTTFDDGGFDISAFGWGLGVDPDPYSIFHSSNMVPQGNNITHWWCPESDELLEKARVALDQEKRKEYLFRWQEIVFEEKPYAVSYIPLDVFAHVDTLEGFDPLLWEQNYSAAPWSIPGEDTIVYGTPAAPEGMLVWRWNSVYGYYCNANIFEGLWQNNESLERVPLIGKEAEAGPTVVFAPADLSAEEIAALEPEQEEVVVCGKVSDPVVFPKYFDITIHEGVTFHDGEELTTEDVQWSFNACKSADTAFQGYGTFRDVYGGSEIIDDYTIRVYVGMPHAAWLRYCDVSILPKDVYGDLPISGEKAATAWMNSDINQGENVIGTGPFKFDSWEADQFWKLTKNEDYWGADLYGEAGSDIFMLKLIPEIEAARVALEKGEIHIMDTFYNLQKIGGDIEATEGLTVSTAEQFGYQHLHFNCRNPYLANKYVRQAISHCIDRAGIIENLLGGYGTKGAVPVAVPSWAYNTNIQADEFSLEKARELMDKAGYRYYVLEKTKVVTEEGETVETGGGTSTTTLAIVGIVALIVGLGIGYVVKRE